MYELRRVTNPDYIGYATKHIAFVTAKNKEAALKKAGLTDWCYLDIRDVPKKKARKILNKAIKDYKYLNTNYLMLKASKLRNKLAKKILSKSFENVEQSKNRLDLIK